MQWDVISTPSQDNGYLITWDGLSWVKTICGSTADSKLRVPDFESVVFRHLWMICREILQPHPLNMTWDGFTWLSLICGYFRGFLVCFFTFVDFLIVIAPFSWMIWFSQNRNSTSHSQADNLQAWYLWWWQIHMGPNIVCWTVVKKTHHIWLSLQ